MHSALSAYQELSGCLFWPGCLGAWVPRWLRAETLLPVAIAAAASLAKFAEEPRPKIPVPR